MEPCAQTFDDEQILSFFDCALPEVYGYLLHRCHDKTIAEDLTSETLLAAVQGMRVHRPESLATGWLIGIARHKLVDHWRREDRRQRHLVLWSSAPPAVAADDELDEGRARHVLSLMNPMQRTALTLRYVDGLSVTEVASAIDRSVTATETLLARARAAFRFRYDQKGDEND